MRPVAPVRPLVDHTTVQAVTFADHIAKRMKRHNDNPSWRRYYPDYVDDVTIKETFETSPFSRTELRESAQAARHRAKDTVS